MPPRMGTRAIQAPRASRMLWLRLMTQTGGAFCHRRSRCQGSGLPCPPLSMTDSAMNSGAASAKRAAPIAWPTATQRRVTPWAAASAFQTACSEPKNGSANTTSPSCRGHRIQTSWGPTCLPATRRCSSSRRMSVPKRANMNLLPPSFQKWLLYALAGTSALAQTPRFTVRDGIPTEWSRQPPAVTESQKAALPAMDRTRLERTILRIGAQGAPALLPPELDKPTVEAWDTQAKIARTPQARFTALFFLNRLKRATALVALDGLTPADAIGWPRHLHLEASIATARPSA